MATGGVKQMVTFGSVRNHTSAHLPFIHPRTPSMLPPPSIQDSSYSFKLNFSGNALIETHRELCFHGESKPNQIDNGY
ncbi:hypothetical protein I79_003910 [Cricetulus griseus]|uniref:Uncharacterized protein n=1 Tax=Cricetulus griseus TaxID=10029 RepID=G3H186_CRIGR|nr:hypothetical protein I79_003910 [Cricetulus griseus]